MVGQALTQSERQKLSDTALRDHARAAAKVEHQAMTEVIETIREVNHRKLYLKLNYTSLFDYVRKDLGYEGGTAQSRIDEDSLVYEDKRKKKRAQEDGDEKSYGATIETEIETKANGKSETAAKSPEGVTDSSFQSVAAFGCSFASSSRAPIESLTPDPADLRSEVKRARTARQPRVPKRIRRIVIQRDRCCQWVNRRTGEICGSTFQLEVDHRTSRWAGGTNEIANLHALCDHHNRRKYLEEAGIHLAF